MFKCHGSNVSWRRQLDSKLLSAQNDANQAPTRLRAGARRAATQPRSVRKLDRLWEKKRSMPNIILLWCRDVDVRGGTAVFVRPGLGK